MAGPLTNLTSTWNFNASFACPHVDAILGALNVNSGLGLSQLFGNASGVAFGANQCKVYTPSISGGANTTIDLSAASNNILSNSAATLVRIFAALLWLPTSTQNSTLGSSASSITIGNAASTPTPIFGLQSTGTIQLNSGEILVWQTPAGGTAGTSNGLVVSTNKNLKIANNDGTNTATPVLLLIGNDA